MDYIRFAAGSGSAWDLAAHLNRIIFPAIFFIGLAALAAAILNSLGSFAVPAASSVFFNLGLIVCSLGVVYRPLLRWIPGGFRGPAVALAVGVLLGGILQLGVQIPELIRRGMSFAPKFSFSDPGVRRVARLMGPSFFGMGVYQINIFVDTIFATSSRMPAGSVTSLYLADRVMQLVLGSYAMAMSTALLPAMSHQQAAGEGEQVKDTFGFSLRIVSFITVPAAVGLFLLRRPIIQVLFQHGQFNPASTSLTAHALLFYSLGLPAFAAIRDHYADVLLGSGHGHSRACRRLCARPEYPSQYDVSAVSVSGAFERKSGAGEFAYGLLQFRRSLFLFSETPRAIERAGSAAVPGQDFRLRGGDGSRVLRRAGPVAFFGDAASDGAGGTAGCNDRGLNRSLFAVGVDFSLRRAFRAIPAASAREGWGCVAQGGTAERPHPVKAG